MLYLSVVKVEAKNREDLLNKLRELSDFDCDFCGFNGEEYNWEETTVGEFESNLEYAIDKVSSIENDAECVKAFFDGWMWHDSYYSDYSVKCLTDDDGNVTEIALAYDTNYHPYG